MAIIVTCQCGKQLRAKDEHAGMQATCPACRKVVVVPGAVPATTKPLPSAPGSACSLPPGMPPLPDTASLPLQSSTLVPHRPVALLVLVVAVLVVGWTSYHFVLAPLLFNSGKSPPSAQNDNPEQNLHVDNVPPLHFDTQHQVSTVSGFDLRSIEKTFTWVQEKRQPILKATREGNEIAQEKSYNNSVESFKRDIQTSIGQRVRWKLPVLAVTRQYVQLMDTWPMEKVYNRNHVRLLTPCIVIEHGGVLQVGKDIPLERAESLKIGEPIELSGKVENVLFPNTHIPDRNILQPGTDVFLGSVTFKLTDVVVNPN